MRFDDRVTGKVDTFAPHARIIHMDIDPTQIGRNVPVEVAVVGDAKALLQQLTPMVTNPPRPDWLQYIANLKHDHPSLNIPASDQLQAQQVIAALDTLLQEDPETTIVTGVGQHQMWAAQFLSFNQSDSFVSSGGLGAMGFELPAALGVQVAKPGTPVWSVAGDGGFQMTLQELATLTEEKLPVKIALINNGYLGMVKQWQETLAKYGRETELGGDLIIGIATFIDDTEEKAIGRAKRYFEENMKMFAPLGFIGVLQPLNNKTFSMINIFFCI